LLHKACLLANILVYAPSCIYLLIEVAVQVATQISKKHKWHEDEEMIEKFREKPGIAVLVVITLLAALFNVYSTKILNASYEESKFPVPYFEAQLSFSAEKIKSWYAYLIEQNTLGIYKRTQHIDFIFMLSVLLLHFSALVLVSRLYPRESLGRKVMIICAFISVLAPLSDVLENLVSYVMLASPVDFPNWLVYPYSGFAAFKFAMFTFAYIAAALGILFAAGSFVKSSIKNQSQQ